MGQLVDADKAIAWRGPMVSGALAQLVDANWGDSDILVLDLPPGTGDVQLSMVQKHKPAGAVIVSTPQDIALIDARRELDLFRRPDVPIVGLVEDMAGYTRSEEHKYELQSIMIQSISILCFKTKKNKNK